jgi:hypothetical protein
MRDMRMTKKNNAKQKRRYAKPRLESVQVDKYITMVMMTDEEPPLPELKVDPFRSNPFKWNNNF